MPNEIAAGVAQVIDGVAFPTVYVTGLGELALPTRSCAITVKVCVPTEPSRALVNVPVFGVGAICGDPVGPHKTTPDPPSVQLYIAVSVWPNVGDVGETVGPIITGAFLSTSNGPNDPCGGWGAEVFPAISFTVTAGIVASFVSVLAGTFVCTVNDEGPTNPEPPALSLAMHGTITSVFCHATAGGVQVRVGGVRSTLIVKVGVDVLTIPPLLVTSVSTTPELSVAA